MFYSKQRPNIIVKNNYIILIEFKCVLIEYFYIQSVYIIDTVCHIY